MRSWSPLGVRVIVATLAGLLAACSEPTATARRFAILDDVGGSDWQSVSVGAEHSCGIKTSGAAYCWGANQYGQLALARQDTTCGSDKTQFRCSLSPQAVQPGVKFQSISAGYRHTCAITTVREAYCWGSNDQGQVADFAPGGPTLTKIPSSLGWSQISAGYTHTCAVRTDGALFCWGANDRGQLGNGIIGSNAGLTRVQITGPVAHVSASQQHTCARTTVGAVFCWGAVWTGRENGLEITRSQPTPQPVPSGISLSSLSVGVFTTCGTDASGFAYCWEANPRGELGDGTEDGSIAPKRVATDLEFVQISAGIVQTCGVVTSGAAYCWGDDTFGQLGVSPSLLVDQCGTQRLPCSKLPVPVYGRQQFTEISTGPGSHSCGVTTRGNLYCWGLGLSGQRGDGTALYAVSVPILVREP
jgi:alpha-tubulin suppressor-like RCC1 family protein